jgi:Sulfotransferase domain
MKVQASTKTVEEGNGEHCCSSSGKTRRYFLALLLVVVLVDVAMQGHTYQSFSIGFESKLTEDGERPVCSSSSSLPGPSEYHIMQARDRAKSLASKEISTIMAIDHPAFQNMTKKYQPKDNWKKLHQPDVSVIGFPKAGTSQLYNILTGHPAMAPFHPNKEFCFSQAQTYLYSDDYEKIQQAFYDINTNLDDLSQAIYGQGTDPNAHGNLTTVNGCLGVHVALPMRQYLGRTKDSKLILLLRDPADWLWAAFNFWQNNKHHDAIQLEKTDWAKPQHHYRSPELFHEMLLAGDRYLPTVELMERFRNDVATLRSKLVAAARKAAPASVLVLKTEDMTPDRIVQSGFLEKLADFVGVELAGFNETTFGSFSNCGNSRGTESHCKKSSSAYTIAGGRSMLPESRELVYLYFAEECKYWQQNFGLIYKDCLDVRQKYVEN